MPPRDKGRPSKERASELGDEIIILALTHFRTYGYEATTIAGLAKALECSKHTIYRRFPDKEALFAAALDFDRKIVLAKVASIDTSAANSLDALREACHALFQLALEPDSTDLYRACIGAVQQFPAVGRQFFQTERDLQMLLEGALRQAQADGYIVAGATAPLAGQLYHATIGEAFLHSLLGLEHVGTAADQADLFARNWAMFVGAYGLKQL